MSLVTILSFFFFFFFNDTATTEIYTLSLHDALPIWPFPRPGHSQPRRTPGVSNPPGRLRPGGFDTRSEEHTSELQSHSDLVCRLLLEKKKKKKKQIKLKYITNKAIQIHIQMLITQPL